MENPWVGLGPRGSVHPGKVEAVRPVDWIGPAWLGTPGQGRGGEPEPVCFTVIGGGVVVVEVACRKAAQRPRTASLDES